MTVVVLESKFFEDLTLGMREAITKTVTHDDIVAFANLSGDTNPVHLSEEFAASTRFGKRIAHGLYTASLFSAILGTRLPGPGAIYLSQTLNFKAPVMIDDTLTVQVEVVELIEKGRRARLKCEALVGDKLVLEGEAVVMVPARAKAVA